jgi:chloramphenicol 3-O-phosphotransferase
MSGMGRILIVTGATGSGKTTTCREFCDAMDEPWFHFGADLFLGTVTPRKFVDGGPRCADGFHFVPDDPARPEGPAHLELGKYGVAMLRTLHEMAAAAARAGQNVIMDHVTTLDPPILQDCVARFEGLPVLFVGLQLSPKLRNERIDARLEEVVKILGPEHGAETNVRSKRVSNFMYDQIFSHDCFDLLVDTGDHRPSAVVAAISARLAEGRGEAFEKLGRKFKISAPPFDSERD